MNNRVSPNYSSSGSLIVSVYSARGAIPIPDALVTIRGSDKDSSGVISVLKTDQSGNTPKITLPTPPAAESESPGNVKPFATYNIEVDKEGFYPRQFLDVPVFSGITSIQPVNLIPLSEYNGESLPPEGANIMESQNPNL